MKVKIIDGSTHPFLVNYAFFSNEGKRISKILKGTRGHVERLARELWP